MSEILRPPSQPPVALCLGGLDPSAGAGLFRDIQVLSSLGVYPMGVSTADTVQNGEACLSIRCPGLPPMEALDALAPHLGGTWGVKLGLCALGTSDLESMARRLADLRPAAMIWDPILAPTRGVGLHGPDALRTLAEVLLPEGSWVVSPNLPEAQALAPDSGLSPEELARPWLALGAASVWLKGGHRKSNQVEDFWITEGGCVSLGACPRLPGERRGTGCSLASAWLAFRLRGWEPMDAARAAGAWLRDSWPRAGAPGGFGRPAFLPVQP